MRIAFIVDKFPNISETFILDEIVGIIRRGIEVDIYALRRGEDRDIHPAYQAFELNRRTFYSVPAIRGRFLRLLAAIPATIRMLCVAPIGTVKCALSRKAGIQTRTIVNLAREFLRRGKTYDLVHAHFGPNGIRAQVLRGANVLRAPLITTFHGYDATSFVIENGTDVYADLAARGDHFIAVSKSMAEKIEQLGMPLSRTSIMPLGVAWSDRLIPSRDMEGNAVRVISIGRFVEKKGFEYAIRAVAQASGRFPDLSYNIVGGGELRPELEALVSELNAGHFITFLGYKDQAQIVELLSTSDILLAPSVTATNGDQESMPIVIKEAMERGLPVVATRHAGIPEIVSDGASGLLADERDIESLANHLVALATDAPRRRRLGDAGRRIILANYDNETLIDDLVKLYRTLVRNFAAIATDG